MSDQQNKGTSTIIKGFSRRGTKTDLTTTGVEGSREENEVKESESTEKTESTPPPVEKSETLVASFRAEVITERQKTSFSSEPQMGADKRLSVAPLSVLMPRLGDVKNLEKYRSSILKRHALLAQVRREDAVERAGRQNSEELMLAQLVRWLGEEQDSDE